MMLQMTLRVHIDGDVVATRAGENTVYIGVQRLSRWRTAIAASREVGIVFVPPLRAGARMRKCVHALVAQRRHEELPRAMSLRMRVSPICAKSAVQVKRRR